MASSSFVSASKSDPCADAKLSAEKKLRFISEDLSPLINSLKEQVVADRHNLVKDKIEENRKKLMSMTNHFFDISNSRKSFATSCTIVTMDLLSQRKERILCTLHNADLPGGEKVNSSCIEETFVSSSVLLGNNVGGKSVFRPIKLQEVPKLPPYTTWIFLDRNQRMTEDQSVVGRRRIYYDQNCGEALICSDSEEEVIEDEEDKKDFGLGEDYVLWKTLQEAGLSEEILDSLSCHFERKPCDIKARYENLLKTEKIDEYIKKGGREAVSTTEDSLVEKDLEAALDSFDNLFCRRCLVFDCRLHGCSQDLVFPAEKQNPWSNYDLDIACSSQCYRLALKSESVAADPPICSVSELRTNSLGSSGMPLSSGKKTPGCSSGRNTCQSESASSNAKIASESSESEVSPHQDGISPDSSLSPSIAKIEEKSCLRKRNSKRVAERVLIGIQKRRKGMSLSDSDSFISGPHCPRDIRPSSSSCHLDKVASSSLQKRKLKSPIKKKSQKKESSALDSHNSSQVKPSGNIVISTSGVTKGPLITDFDESLRKEFVDENTCKPEVMKDTYWKAIEKSLFAKGLEIFGNNSCLIARNLMNGMKTCSEVFRYMNFIDNKVACNNVDGINSQIDGQSKGSEFRRRSRFLRRRGRVRRLKYTWKSAGYHSIRKRISERKDQPCRQYNPCGCQSTCGKQCSCLLNGTCCEKYCGCPKMCKNRFRGCHCAKSQCRSRQCPCFAANRECDPDVCRNCWVGCGDGSFGGPAQRGDNYECRNMKLFLKQQQRVLLGRSDVSGWGAFLKNSVAKHEYLGEYTGELISHREADKRGKIYDRENSSFLFNLNDQFVLDAYRKGDKLKFANHSPDPNCYAKVIMVAGDHRVGIFAKERINAGEELFYDYRYEPDRAPAWARKPETSSLKKDEATPNGRAKKLA